MERRSLRPMARVRNQRIASPRLARITPPRRKPLSTRRARIPIPLGKIVKEESVRRAGVETTYQHYSNGQQQWVVITRTAGNRRPQQVKMSLANFRQSLRKTGSKNIRGLLATAAMHADMFKGLAEHGKGILATGMGDLAEIAFHLS